MRTNRWFDRGWIALWGIVATIWCVTASARLSATFDEPHYLKHGLHAWRSGSYFSLLRAGTMPLPTDVQLLPVYVWEQVRDRPFNLDTEFETVLQTARAGNLVFLWLLLYFCWRLGYRFGGPWAARLAVPFIACDPNFLAHASLATTDVAVSACLAMFAEIYLAGRDREWRFRVAAPAFCFAAALLAKASALAFGINMMLAFELHRSWRQASRPVCPDWLGGLSPRTLSLSRKLVLWLQSLWPETRAFRRDFWQIVGLGLLATFVYCGSDWRADRGIVKWADSLPPGLGRDAAVFAADNLRVFPNAGQGIVYQIVHNFRGHGAYVAGEWHRRAVWYYFPLTLTMKLTLPVLLMFGITLAARPKSYAHALGVVAACLFLFTLNCRVQIGIRLILPFVSLLLVCLAVALMNLAPARRRPLALAAVCLVLPAPMLSIWPHGLCYFNSLWGGPDLGYRYLSDSNYDWGQGIDDLARWQETHGEPPLKIWYYGADPRMARRPEHVPLHAMNVMNENELAAQVGGHYLAVGTSLLYSDPALTPSAEAIIKLLKTKKPVARTMTFFIYDFTEPRETKVSGSVAPVPFPVR